jgi:Carbohydrate-binding family 9
MIIDVPHSTVPPAPGAALDLDDTDAWDKVARLPPFILADGSGPAVQQTVVRVCRDAAALYVRFDCEDRDIWGTYTQRDDPIYDEEVVEMFIAPGARGPVHYLEFEVSPDGVLLDARVYNPTSTRADLQVEVEWLCPGVRWAAGRDDAAHHWWAALAVPWAAVAPDARPPELCRANFYRIERPRGDAPEYSCWSPTLTEPADFHKPQRFGLLVLR